MTTSLLATLVPVALLLLLAALLARRVPFYRTLLDRFEPGRFDALDGLRGFLAFGVFFHHAAVQQQYLRTGQWASLSSQVYDLLGPRAVLFFFFLTGFLFWSKAIAANGRVAPVKLVRSRLRRLAPMYLAAAAAIVIICLIQTGLAPRESAFALTRDIARMLALGLVDAGPINGLSTVPVNAAVTWTLWYEWMFYLSLPLLAFFATSRLRFAGMTFAAAVLWVASHKGPVAGHFPHLVADGLWLHFLCGMAAAHLVRVARLRTLLAARSLTFIPILAVIACFLVRQERYALLPAFVAFTCFAAGNDLLGLLTSRPARLLGTVSYSVYLLHGIVLYLAFRAIDPLVPMPSVGPVGYWLAVCACAAIVLLVSCGTYRVIEHPFLAPPPTRRRVPRRKVIEPNAAIPGLPQVAA